MVYRPSHFSAGRDSELTYSLCTFSGHPTEVATSTSINRPPADALTNLSWADLYAEAERFGVSRFRPGQRQVMEAVLAGRNVLGIMPTGAGKSLCYQLPAMFLTKPVVVVSPLIALMQDQQEKLEAAD